MTTHAPEEGRLTYATALMVSFKDHDIIILRSSSKFLLHCSQEERSNQRVLSIMQWISLASPTAEEIRFVQYTSRFSTRNLKTFISSGQASGAGILHVWEWINIRAGDCADWPGVMISISFITCYYIYYQRLVRDPSRGAAEVCLGAALAPGAGR